MSTYSVIKNKNKKSSDFSVFGLLTFFFRIIKSLNVKGQLKPFFFHIYDLKIIEQAKLISPFIRDVVKKFFSIKIM